MNRNLEGAEYIAASQLFFWKLGSVDVPQMSTVTSPQAEDMMCLGNSGAEGQADYLQWPNRKCRVTSFLIVVWKLGGKY